MNKILKILSILIIGFVMFSCSTPTNDPETPAPNPEVPTYSITFKIEDSDFLFLTDYLNTLPEFKNLEKGTEVTLYKSLYTDNEAKETTKEIIVGTSMKHLFISQDYDNSDIDSVVIGNEDVEVKVTLDGSEDV